MVNGIQKCAKFLPTQVKLVTHLRDQSLKSFLLQNNRKIDLIDGKYSTGGGTIVFHLFFM